MAVQHRTTVCDPVHKILDFSAVPSAKGLVKSLLDTREVQRLRRISQLGLAAHVFPCATHSRFAHSLGAAYLAGVVAMQLSSCCAERSTEIDNYTPLIIAAGLLHDVGHGPFSHAFERALQAILPEENKIKHEQWTRAVVLGPLNNLLHSQGVSAKELGDIFLAKGSEQLPTYLRQIISSQLDVDRMDYLVRDAHFSGVPLGQIDLHYLIRSLTVVDHSEKHATLGITQKGIKPYEAFALARHMMNRTVYYNAKVAVLEFLMEESLRELALGIRAGRDVTGVPPALRSLALSEATNTEQFINQNLPAYLKLTEDSVWTALSHVEETWKGRAQDLATRLLGRHLPEYFYVQSGKRRELARALRVDDLTENDFRIRATKSTAYDEGMDEDGVFVLTDDETVDTVSRHSFALTAYANKPEAETLLIILNVSKREKILAAARTCIVGREPKRESSQNHSGSAVAPDSPLSDAPVVQNAQGLYRRTGSLGTPLPHDAGENAV